MIAYSLMSADQKSMQTNSRGLKVLTLMYTFKANNPLIVMGGIGQAICFLYVLCKTLVARVTCKPSVVSVD